MHPPSPSNGAAIAASAFLSNGSAVVGQNPSSQRRLAEAHAASQLSPRCPTTHVGVAASGAYPGSQRAQIVAASTVHAAPSAGVPFGQVQCVGDGEGLSLGRAEGLAEGDALGDSDGAMLGLALGDVLGATVGLVVGASVLSQQSM